MDQAQRQALFDNEIVPTAVARRYMTDGQFQYLADRAVAAILQLFASDVSPEKREELYQLVRVAVLSGAYVGMISGNGPGLVIKNFVE
jgi:hypothetical protein